MKEGTTDQTRAIGEMSAHASPSPPTLRGRWLLLAQVAWVTAAVGALGQFVISIPARYSTLLRCVAQLLKGAQIRYTR